MPKTVIGLRDLEIFAYHGYYPEERAKGNTFIINVQVYLNSWPDTNDELNNTLNYEDLYRICMDEMKITSKLIETVAVRIANEIKRRYDVAGGSIKIEKCRPPLDAMIKSSYVELEF